MVDPMTTDEFRSALATLGVTAQNIHHALGISRRHAYRLACGTSSVSLPVAAALRSELARARVREHRLVDGRVVWQGYRDGSPCGPRCAEKWMAQWFALDLPR